MIPAHLDQRDRLSVHRPAWPGGLRKRGSLLFVAAALLVSVACKDESAPRPARLAQVSQAVHAAPRPRAPSSPPSDQAGQVAEEASGAKPAGTGSECDRLCQISEPLHCQHQAECPARCQSMATSPICSQEVKGLFTCLFRQPAAHWECDDDGVGAIRDPHCHGEQARLAACLERSLTK